MNRIAAATLFAFLSAAGAFCAGPAQAAVLEFKATLAGSEQVPPNASPATGTADVVLNDVTDLLSVNLSFSGLEAPATAAHIHCCAPPSGNAAVALPFGAADGFPFGSTSGTFSHTYDLATALSGITEAAFIAGLEAGEAYVNIHDSLFPGGEIRGDLTAVPRTLDLDAAVPKLRGRGPPQVASEKDRLSASYSRILGRTGSSALWSPAVPATSGFC